MGYVQSPGLQEELPWWIKSDAGKPDPGKDVYTPTWGVTLPGASGGSTAPSTTKKKKKSSSTKAGVYTPPPDVVLDSGSAPAPDHTALYVAGGILLVGGVGTYLLLKPKKGRRR